MEEFRERGFCVLEAAALPAAAIRALRRELDPWFEEQFAERADGSFGDWWHSGPENEGTGRVAVSNAILELSPLGSSVAQTTTDFMLQPCMLDFARTALGSTPVLDDVQLAAYPIVGEGGHASAAARTDADGAASELHVWHRDSHNTHGQLRGFHECWDGRGDEPPQPRPYAPPAAVNFIVYLQDTVLRLMPRSHLDFTEIPFDGAHRQPHPRECALPLRAGQVAVIHGDVVHSGMLNASHDERRYYLSVFFTQAGLPSRDLPSLVQDVPQDHPLSAALRAAAAAEDEAVLRVLGVAPPAGSPYDFLVSLGTDSVPHAGADKTDGVLVAAESSASSFLAHLKGTAALLSSWGCDEATVLAGLFHSVHGTAAFDLFSLPMDADSRGQVASHIGEEAERCVMVNCAMERGSFDEALLAAAARLPSAGIFPLTVRQHSGGGLLELRSERELAMLAAVQLADWLHQAEAVNRSGFGSDATKSAYTRGGVPGHWRWAEGRMHGFRAEAYEAMLGLLDRFHGTVGGPWALSHRLCYERLREGGAPPCEWRPAAALAGDIGPARL